MKHNGNIIFCHESLITADDSGICFKTSKEENASASFFVGQFQNNFSAEVDFLLLSFPLPTQGRMSAGFQLQSGENKFSVGRWRDNHINAYWLWNGVTSLLYSTTHTKGRLRLLRIEGRLYCDYFDVEWVNIGDFNVDEGPARLSLEVFKCKSDREVDVLFSKLNVQTSGPFTQACNKEFIESFKETLLDLKKRSTDFEIKSSPYFSSMFSYLENAIDNYQIFKNQVDNYLGSVNCKEILELGGGYNFPHGGLNILMLILEGAKSAIGIDISFPDLSSVKMNERRRFWDLFFQILKHTSQKYYECSLDLMRPIKELASDSNSRLRFFRMDAERMTFRDDMLDLVISNAVLEHVRNPEKFLKEIYRVLKPSGTTLISWNPFTSLSMGGHSVGIPYYYPWAHLRLSEKEHIDKLRECYSDKKRYETAFPVNQVPREDLAAEYAKEPEKYRASMIADLNKMRAPEFLKIVSELGFENVYTEYIIEEKHRRYLTEEVKKQLHLFSEEELLMTGMISVLRKAVESSSLTKIFKMLRSYWK